MGKETRLIVENCEKGASDWLMAEYNHSASIWPGTIFTNVLDDHLFSLLSEVGTPAREDVLEYTGGKGCILLDHQSPVELKTEDFEEAEYIIVGGILGYDKPKGRTKEFITSRFDPELNIIRNLGAIQLTIDSAAFVARAICLGARLSELEITKEVDVQWDEVHSTHLPYGYPVVDGKIVMTPGLVEILRRTNS